MRIWSKRADPVVDICRRAAGSLCSRRSFGELPLAQVQSCDAFEFGVESFAFELVVYAGGGAIFPWLGNLRCSSPRYSRLNRTTVVATKRGNEIIIVFESEAKRGRCGLVSGA